MLHNLSHTKVIWSITEKSFEKHGTEKLAATLAAGPQEALRATANPAMLEHLKDLRVQLIQKIRESTKTQRTPEGFFPYLLSFIGRRAHILVPDNNVMVAAGELLDLNFKTNLKSYFSQVSPTISNIFEVVVTSADMISKLNAGSRLTISYGQVELTILEITHDGNTALAKARVDSGGKILSGMDVDSVDINSSLFPLLPVDEAILEKKFDGLADYIVVDGITSEGELQLLRHRLGLDSESRRHPSVKINATVKDVNAAVPSRLILKVDSKTILDMLPKLLSYVDGVLLSRSELGMTIHPHYLPIVQKEIIAQCNQAAKIVLVASELMYSMRINPTPTRAEVSDLANAITDGTDGILLAEEITEGPFSPEVAQVTKDTLKRTQEFIDQQWNTLSFEIKNDDDAIAYGAMSIAQRSKAKAIVCLTEGGYTALRLASLRAPIPVIAVCYNKAVMRQLSLVHSTHTLLLENTSFDEILNQTKLLLAQHFDMRRGESFIFVSLTASSVADRNSNLFTLQEID